MAKSWRDERDPFDMVAGLPVTKLNTPDGRRLRLVCAGIIRLIASLKPCAASNNNGLRRKTISEAEAASRRTLAAQVADSLDGGSTGGLPGRVMKNHPVNVLKPSRAICRTSGRRGVNYATGWYLDMMGFSGQQMQNVKNYSIPRIADIIRDVFPVPLHNADDITIEPPQGSRREWHTSTVANLARQAWDSRDWLILPILADALQDAGCDREELLQHLRGPGPHCRGCWALDSVLQLNN